MSIESDAYSFRADHIRATPAAIRWISAEPLLGPLPSLDLTGIDWVVAGGESGPKAHPMHPTWVRDLRDRCVCTGAPGCQAHRHTFGCYGNRSHDESSRPTAFLFKQWGEWVPWGQDDPRLIVLARPSHKLHVDGTFDRDVGHHEPGSADFVKVGKKLAGRMLDGRTWDEYPA